MRRRDSGILNSHWLVANLSPIPFPTVNGAKCCNTGNQEGPPKEIGIKKCAARSLDLKMRSQFSRSDNCFGTPVKLLVGRIRSHSEGLLESSRLLVNSV